MVTSDEATRVRRPDEDTPAKLQLVVIGTDEYRTYAVEPPGPITIGRSDRSMVVLGDELASREHARVHVVPELAVEDLESANGTLVGGTIGLILFLLSQLPAVLSHYASFGGSIT